MIADGDWTGDADSEYLSFKTILNIKSRKVGRWRK